VSTVRAIAFDVGETLVDEERYWRVVAEAAGVGPHVLWAALGVTIARGEEHHELFRHLGLERPDAWDDTTYTLDDLYPDVTPCLERLATDGYQLIAAGNQTAELERWTREAGLPFDRVTSSVGLGIRKPDPRFFERLVELIGRPAGEIAYVGDRVDNDIGPAAAAGLVAIHLRRGPWGRLQNADGVASATITSLDELPEVFAAL
jgi:HAD superfamily hydrolase (TIGR01549 family)